MQTVTLSFQGDKSLSHRAAILAALASGKSTLFNYLKASDTLNTLKAFAALGLEVSEHGGEIEVNSKGMSSWPRDQNISLELGNSGTAARLLLGLFCGIEKLKVTLNGDESLSKRPMARVTKVLQQFDASFHPDDRLPITIAGKNINNIDTEETLGSAQVKSALMLAALAGNVSLKLIEKKRSRDHTENMLRYTGIHLDIEEKTEGRTIVMQPPYQIEARSYHIWGDISAAAFFVVQACLGDKTIRIENVLLNPYRDHYLTVLKKMGADITIIKKNSQCGELGGDIIVKPSKLKGIDIKTEEIPAIIDELPILTIAGLFCVGRFSFRGAEELRKKESDRISAMVSNLLAVGLTENEVEEFNDGLSLTGNANYLLGGEVESFDDHRIVMSFEIASLRSLKNGAAQKINIQGRSWVNTSFPDFYAKLKEVSTL